MGYRIFRDSRGTEWQAWDVVPQLAERRGIDRRRATSADAPSSRAQERRSADRRVTTGRRLLLSAGLDGGWLCFEARVEKRRLTPIPGDWLGCDEACLERYCREAKLVTRSSGPIDISSIADSRS